MKTGLNTVYQRNNNGIMNEVAVRFINHNFATYLRKEDVIELIEELADTEEIDVKNRFLALARNMNMVGVDKVGI